MTLGKATMMLLALGPLTTGCVTAERAGRPMRRGAAGWNRGNDSGPPPKR